MGLLAAYRGLSANGPLVRLLGGLFMSAIGDWLYFVALLVLVYEDSGSALFLGLVGATRQVPFILLSVPAGIVADRYDRRRVLFWTNVARAGMMAVLTVVAFQQGPLWLVFGLAVLATCFATPYGPTIGALLPEMVRDESEFGPANSAYATLENLAYGIGPAVGGLLIVFGGIAAAFFLNAVAFSIGAFVVWRLPRPVPRGAPAVSALARAEEREWVADVADHVGPPPPVPSDIEDPGPVEPSTTPEAGLAGDGASFRSMTPRLGGLLVLSGITYFFTGGLEVITVLIAVTMLGLGEGATGFLNAAIGVGGVIGALVSGALIVRRRLEAPLLLGSFAMGLGLMATGATTTLGLAMVTLVVVETGDMILAVAEATLLHRSIPDAFRGRAFGLMDAVRKTALVVGALVLPALAGEAYVREVLFVSGLVTIAACSLLVLFAFGRLATPAKVVAAALRVPSLPTFAGLPVERLEDAMERMRELHVVPGQVVVREGDPADRFYVIARGRFRVTQHGAPGEPERFLRELGPDNVFGELGLLRGIPRTATVTAETDGVLATLEAADFLDLVASGPGVRSRFLGLYGGGGAVAS